MGPEWRPWGLVTRLGLTVVLTLLITLFAGIWLDSVFGTRPLMTLVLSLVGMIAATVNCYRMVMESLANIPQVRRRDADNNREEPSARNGHPETRSEFDEPAEDDED